MTPWAALGMVPLPKKVKGRVFAYPPDRVPKTGCKPPLQDRVKRVLSEGPAGVQEIAQELGAHRKSVTDCVGKLKRRGEVRVSCHRQLSSGGQPVAIYELVESSDAQTD